MTIKAMDLIKEKHALQKYKVNLPKFIDIINDLLLDRSVKDIAHGRAVPAQVVHRIKDDFSEEIGTYEERTIQRLQRAISLGAEYLCESIENKTLHPDKIASGLSTLIASRELLVGKPTSRASTVDDTIVDIKRLNDLVKEAEEVGIKTAPGLEGPPLLDGTKAKRC